MKSTLNVAIECMGCKESFEANIENVKQKEYEYEGNKVKIVYVDCPSCNRRHYVQIDNEESDRLKVNNLLMFKKLSKKKLSDKRVTKTENKTFKSLRNQLLDLRTELMKEYEGRTVTDTLTGESVTIHFTFC